jgi:hypothetical protein
LNSAWAERYGGNFGLVEKLIDASLRYARRKRHLQHAYVGILLLISSAGIIYAIGTNRLKLELLADLYLRRTVLSLERETSAPSARSLPGVQQMS